GAGARGQVRRAATAPRPVQRQSAVRRSSAGWYWQPSGRLLGRGGQDMGTGEALGDQIAAGNLADLLGGDGLQCGDVLVEQGPGQADAFQLADLVEIGRASRRYRMSEESDNL